MPTRREIMGKSTPPAPTPSFSTEQMERIAWIAEQTKQALLSGMSAMQQLEQAESDKVLAGEPVSDELQQMRDKLGRLVLAWDEVQSQMNRLVAKRTPARRPEQQQRPN
ncbi:hypothetical protein Mmc1_0889 [Magnetococcus marinus MC-1]|uniref:Uncharacterized protein n=2 Tax=Magnetococcus TaxID=162171 RepID=A0L615_MAGMM|nr:hypothetical protein Mmc1_0889 [Magnetococcus marinus MC-1]